MDSKRLLVALERTATGFLPAEITRIWVENIPPGTGTRAAEVSQRVTVQWNVWRYVPPPIPSMGFFADAFVALLEKVAEACLPIDESKLPNPVRDGIAVALWLAKIIHLDTSGEYSQITEVRAEKLATRETFDLYGKRIVEDIVEFGASILKDIVAKVIDWNRFVFNCQQDPTAFVREVAGDVVINNRRIR